MADKCVNREHVALAEREVSHRESADGHTNVSCYPRQAVDAKFLYIVLELSPASFEDIIERRDDKHPELCKIFDCFNPKRALRDITSGLGHLHSNGIVHRDIKPQNILVLISNSNEGELCMVISDLGLSRKLESGETSFEPTVGSEGTVGWMAPEILRSRGTRTMEGGQTLRLTKSVDIFALGCLGYYCLTGGKHPYGDLTECEDNILRDQKSLQDLEGLDEDVPEAVDLITSMLAYKAADRCVCPSQLLHC